MAVETTRLSRHVPLDSLHNVRDLGGYQGRAGLSLRWQRVYRADNLARASRSDLHTLTGLGIKTVIDLRTDREALREPSPTVFPGAYVSSHHVPLLRATWDEVGYRSRPGEDEVDFLAARYLEMLVEGAPAIADALRLMAMPSAYPIVFHCALGKDRTGILAAVLLGVLGVHPETIADDYALSSVAVAAYEERLRTGSAAERDQFLATPPAYLAAPPASMTRVLAQVRERCRSMVGYVRSIGVDFDTVEALHKNLLV